MTIVIREVRALALKKELKRRRPAMHVIRIYVCSGVSYILQSNDQRTFFSYLRCYANTIAEKMIRQKAFESFPYCLVIEGSTDRLISNGLTVIDGH